MVKIYKQPFAHSGDTIAIPDTSQLDGKMSNAEGWTNDYQLRKDSPNYKPVGRREMNGVLKEVTEALGQVQIQGSASWSSDGAPYPINAQVYHNGKQWRALRSNSVAPAEGEDWTAIGTAAMAWGTISANITLEEADNGKPFLITNDCTITIDSGLSAGWNVALVPDDDPHETSHTISLVFNGSGSAIGGVSTIKGAASVALTPTSNLFSVVGAVE